MVSPASLNTPLAIGWHSGDQPAATPRADDIAVDKSTISACYHELHFEAGQNRVSTEVS